MKNMRNQFAVRLGLGLAAGLTTLVSAASLPAEMNTDDPMAFVDAILAEFDAENAASSGVVDAAQAPVERTQRIFRSTRSGDDAKCFPTGKRFNTGVLDVQALEASDINAAAQGPCGLRMGIVQPIFADTLVDGTWTKLDDGGHLWTVEVTAAGARSLRLRVAPWNPPAGAELMVYAPGKAELAHGPYTAGMRPTTQRFWTPTVYGDTARLEYYLPAGLDHTDPANAIIIDNVLNAYRGPTSSVGGEPNGTPALSCHLDSTCYSAYATERRAVGSLNFINDGAGYFCSGSALNRVGSDFTPLISTAWHCGVTEGNVDTFEIVWDYVTSSCNGSAPDPDGLPRSLGIELLVNDPDSDWTLVGVDDQILPGFFLGSDTGGISNGTNLTGIHHPRGEFKRITFMTKDGDGTSCIPADAWFLDTDDGDGEIEPASSGSPLIDSSDRVRGVASCASWGCNTDNGASYGRINVAWPDIEPYIIPENTVYVDSSFGGAERGTIAAPFQRVMRGVFAVDEGGTVEIDGGSYGTNAPVTIRKAMTLDSSGGTVTIGN